VLAPEVTLVVHPIDTAAHPTVPPGWRWAVQVGGGRPDDVERCAQAGWTPTETQAWEAGEPCAVAAVQACRTFGIPAGYRRLRLLRDPIPAGRDQVRVIAGI
jgi:hypothetical protein